MNRRTLNIEIFCAHPLPKSPLLSNLQDVEAQKHAQLIQRRGSRCRATERRISMPKKTSRYQKGDSGHLDTTKKTSGHPKRMHPLGNASSQARPFEGSGALEEVKNVATLSLTKTLHGKCGQCLWQCRPKVQGRFACPSARNPVTYSILLGCSKWRFKRWGFKPIRGYSKTRSLSCVFWISQFLFVPRRKRQKKGETGREARHALEPPFVTTYLWQPNFVTQEKLSEFSPMSSRIMLGNLRNNPGNSHSPLEFSGR